ncbi:hypothetical protein G6M86_03560 [Agrobacterium tumefaciens]|uniref:Uncharacterized protein n=1 Tax=Agrobacterium tumefaciens TaxID=358 RepID=A0AAJ4T8W7_AGRTU|nr:hypothetical protein G6M86_03560 [Agrobacterium tumefaciens]
MTSSFVAHLQSKGFSHVSFDMSKAVTITAWRRTERKTYSVYQAASLEDAEAKLLAMINAPEEVVVKPVTDFDDILG